MNQIIFRSQRLFVSSDPCISSETYYIGRYNICTFDWWVGDWMLVINNC